MPEPVYPKYTNYKPRGTGETHHIQEVKMVGRESGRKTRWVQEFSHGHKGARR